MVFEDMRGWIEALRAAGELHEIDAEVHWDRELGAVARKAFGNGDGPAVLFNAIADYRSGRCTRLFTGGLSNYSRVAMMFGLPKDAPITDLVLAARTAFSATWKSGPGSHSFQTRKGSAISLAAQSTMASTVQLKIVPK